MLDEIPKEKHSTVLQTAINVHQKDMQVY